MKLTNSQKNRLKNNYGPWALVTGASSGIGKELAKRIAESGLNLILTARRKGPLQNLGDSLQSEYQISVRTIIADISINDDIDLLIGDTKDINIGLVVLNAGFGTSGPFVKSPLVSELNMLDVNCKAPLILAHHFSKKFMERKKGGIIFLSSIVGFQGVPNAAHYSATKAYIQSLGEALYHELKYEGVDVLTAAPGPVNSGFGNRANMKIGKALKPEDIGIPILRALGRSSVVFPGTLTKVLIYSLRTVPRWGKVRIMKMVMGGMTKHQT